MRLQLTISMAQRPKRVDPARAQDAWGRAQWLWDRPPLKRLRLTISMAQWTVRLPALLALVASQARDQSL